MAREKTPEEQTTDNERKQLAEEKKKLKKEQQAQRKEAKRRAKEIAKQEDALDDGSEGNSLLTFGATILIVVLWMAVICAIIKLDIGIRKLCGDSHSQGCAGAEQNSPG